MTVQVVIWFLDLQLAWNEVVQWAANRYELPSKWRCITASCCSIRLVFCLFPNHSFPLYRTDVTAAITVTEATSLHLGGKKCHPRQPSFSCKTSVSMYQVYATHLVPHLLQSGSQCLLEPGQFVLNTCFACIFELKVTKDKQGSGKQCMFCAESGVAT